MITLRYTGPIPSKKNAWKSGRGGRRYIDEETKQLIFAMTLAFAAGWRKAGRTEPVSRPELHIRLFVTHDRQDSDNMVTTVLDCLQAAGVLVNDNTRHLRDWRVSAWPAGAWSEADLGSAGVPGVAIDVLDGYPVKKRVARKRRAAA